MKKYIYTGATLVILLTADIITKYLVVYRLGLSDSINLFGGFLRIRLVYNEGGVFGILQGYKTMFLVISIIVLLLMIGYYIYEKNKTMIFSISMAMIVSGALGNIIDRLIEGRPGVVDFISVGVDGVYRWPSFNIADSSIVAGAFLLIIVFYTDEKKRKLQAESELKK